MAKLRFKASEVLPLIEHALASKEHKLTFEERAKIYGADNCWNPHPGEEKRGSPGLWLVKDEGIYLMSNGKPGQAKPVGTGVVVAYAEGFDPSQGDRGEVWDRARDAVGGDDFALALAVDEKLAAEGRRFTEFAVNFNTKTVAYQFRRPIRG